MQQFIAKYPDSKHRGELEAKIDEIDPNAFVSQGAVNGVYGMGFDRWSVLQNDVR